MLRNILGLNERRIADVMVHRADIVAVKRDIPLGELMSLFERRGAFAARGLQRNPRRSRRHRSHPRPAGIHDREGARSAIPTSRSARSRFRRASTCARSISRMPLVGRQHHPQAAVRAAVDAARSTCWRRCRPRASIWRWWSTNMAAPTAWCRSRTSSSRSSARSTTSTTATSRRRSSGRATTPSSPMRAPASRTCAPMIGEEFVTGEAGEEVETLGGYLVAHVGRLPVRGEVISGPGNFEIEVLDADPRRVKRLRDRPPQGAPCAPRDRASGAAARPRRMPNARRRPMTIRRRRPRRRSRLAVTSRPANSALGRTSIILAWGWKRAVIALVAGALSALAMAPFNAWPVLFLTFPGRGLADRRRRRRKMARRAGGRAMAGWWFGLRLFRAGPVLDRLRVPGRCARPSPG